MSARDDYPHLRNISDNFIAESRPPSYSREIDRALKELDNLRHWKEEEATAVIAEWDKLWEEASCPGPLGVTKAAGLREALKGDGVI